jgi:hypothetical protein
MTRRTRLFGVLPAAALAAAAVVVVLPTAPARGAWPPLTTAGPFLRAEIGVLVAGRYDDAWRSLYPAHQLLVSQADYVRCERALPFAAPFRSARVLRVRRAAVRVPGTLRPVAGVAVTMRIGVRYGRDGIAFTHTFHLVPVSGRWTWLLSPQRYRLYRSGACPAKPAA